MDADTDTDTCTKLFALCQSSELKQHDKRRNTQYARTATASANAAQREYHQGT